MGLTAVIMAAGAGKRMKSDLPKVLHKVLGVEMVRHVMAAASFGGKPVVVVGHGAAQVMDALGDSALYACQKEQLGTGHAVMMARPFLEGRGGYTLVLAGDMPLLRKETLQKLSDTCREQGYAAMVLTSIASDPAGYGRILRGEDGCVLGIVEEKDATPRQRTIREVNSSVYCFETGALLASLGRLSNDNAQREYYLTDCIDLLVDAGQKVGALVAEDPMECMGVNDQAQLALCEAEMERRAR